MYSMGSGGLQRERSHAGRKQQALIKTAIESVRLQLDCLLQEMKKTNKKNVH